MPLPGHGFDADETCWIKTGVVPALPIDPVDPLEAVVREALQAAVEPPFAPAQLHAQGPAPLTAEAVPVVHRLAVGLVERVAPFEEPQAPLTGVEATTFLAVQAAVVPPFAPAQLHVQGPAPATADAVPVAHRLALGTLASVAPFEAPQAPLTAAGGGVVEEVAATVA
jgi:hypothetical protein